MWKTTDLLPPSPSVCRCACSKFHFWVLLPFLQPDSSYPPPLPQRQLRFPWEKTVCKICCSVIQYRVRSVIFNTALHKIALPKWLLIQLSIHLLSIILSGIENISFMLEFIHLLKLVSAVTSSKKPFLIPRLESFPLTCVAPELCFVICQNIKNVFLSLRQRRSLCVCLSLPQRFY